ncbi:hypothetical protein [uncultured Corynebacterium sp.]|uniref:hypothetical protein n=1 Tax=uncultured Corynebacterium sp. TaxID=159447 RepID=UPI0025DB254C|nr:hypothetical protein [uncultured Corynebacterium sp.]
MRTPLRADLSLSTIRIGVLKREALNNTGHPLVLWHDQELFPKRVDHELCRGAGCFWFELDNSDVAVITVQLMYVNG